MNTRQVNYYQEISFSVRSEDVEAATDIIIENITGGLILENEDGDTKTTIRFYIADRNDLSSKLDVLKNHLLSISQYYRGIKIDVKRIKNLDWEEAYRKSVEPVEIGSTIVVVPPWRQDGFENRIEIILEPKMAFGTGRHETTMGTLMELEKLDLKGKSLLDLGCGSGILGIYAARRGASEVLGLDIDPLAVENSGENYRLNGVAEVCSSRAGSVEVVPTDKRFDIVMVNIIKSVILPILGSLQALVGDGGAMILSGFLEQDQKEVDEALRQRGLTKLQVRDDDGWLTYTVRV